MDWTSTSLRVFRAVAEYGSFTAAAQTLGYSQSAVSRQVAALEHAAGAKLFDRVSSGARVTAAGRTLLTSAATALDELDRAVDAVTGAAPRTATVRVGLFTSIAAALLPSALDLMRVRAPHVRVLTRQGATPSLVRSLRASTVDLAVLGMPPFPAIDDQEPVLELETLVEGELLVAVPAGSPIGDNGGTTLAELANARWVASPHTSQEPGFGVWPALPNRPHVDHQARDWLSKLALVAAGYGVTTVPPYVIGLFPRGVRPVRVVDGPAVTRRAVLARVPGSPSAGASELRACLHEGVRDLLEP